MNEVKRAYFIAGGRALEEVLRWNAEKETSTTAFAALFHKVGIRRAEGTRSGPEFCMTDDAQPLVPGMRLVKGSHTCWVFDKKTPEGKALAQEWSAVRYPSLMRLNVGVRDVLGDGMRLFHTVPERIGETWVLCCPYVDGKDLPSPHDSTPIKTSEYWAMKEAVEPAKVEA